jgi:nucleotide-binding universal stress UspA family protein
VAGGWRRTKSYWWSGGFAAARQARPDAVGTVSYKVVGPYHGRIGDQVARPGSRRAAHSLGPTGVAAAVIAQLEPVAPDNHGMILICYDGSADAQCAIDSAAELLGGHAATVLTIWEGFATVMARAGAGFGVGALDFERIEAACERAASERAEEGTQRARGAGLIAEPRVRERGVTIWSTILEEAAALDPSAIVLGSRGLTGIKSLLLGSVSHGVLQHADRPVIVVPSREVAADRVRARSAE